MKSELATKSNYYKPMFLRLAERYVRLNPFILKDKVARPRSNGVGRPSVMTQEVVGKLQFAFACDCTVEEACLLAGIHRDTYYTFLKDYPEFSDRITALRAGSILVARMVLLSGVEDDPYLALKYLERKCPQEFSLRGVATQPILIQPRTQNNVDPNTRKIIRQLMGE